MNRFRQSGTPDGVDTETLHWIPEVGRDVYRVLTGDLIQEWDHLIEEVLKALTLEDEIDKRAILFLAGCKALSTIQQELARRDRTGTACASKEALISRDKVDEIKHHSDIVQEIENLGITLRKVGTRYVGFCPFHSENTPSFNVYQDDQHWFCYGCNTGGDVIKLVMRSRNMTFIEALRFLGQQCGVEVIDPYNRARAAAIAKLGEVINGSDPVTS